MARITVDVSDSVSAADGVVVTRDMLHSLGERLLANFPRYFPGTAFDAAGSSARVLRLGQASSYPLFAATLVPGAAGGARDVIIKFAPVFDVNNEGLTEYRHLTLMHDRLAGRSALRVPRPLDFLADVNALVMERVGGRRFNRVLLESAVHGAGVQAGERLQSAARLCGAWLADFHAATAAGGVTAFDEAFAASVEEKVVQFRGHGLPAAVAEAIARTVRDLRAFGAGRPVALADQHGDFGPQNVHVGDDHVCVFDLNYNTTAPIYHDICYFLVTLETMNPYPHQWRFDRRRVAVMRAPFLAGYFGGAFTDATHGACLEGYYLRSLLFRCAKQRRNTAARGRVALAAFDFTQVRGYYARRLARQCGIIQERLRAAP